MTRNLAMHAAWLAVIAIIQARAFAEDDKARATVKPADLHVTRGRSNPKLFGPGQAFSDRIWVNLLVNVPGRELLRVDNESKLMTFADDMGNSLIDPKAPASKSFTGSVLSLDRASMIVVVANYNRAPAEGSARIHIKGDLVLAHGLEVKETEAKVDLGAKGDQKVGALILRMDPMKKAPNGHYIDLVGAARAIKAITAVGADGKEVMVSAAYSIPTNAGPRLFTFYVPKTAGEITLKISYYGREAKVTAPVDLAFGAGM